jgi:chromosome segregation ATPase
MDTVTTKPEQVTRQDEQHQAKLAAAGIPPAHITAEMPLAEAEPRLKRLQAELQEVRGQQPEARTARDQYRSGIAKAKVDGGALPSRAGVAAAETHLQELEDLEAGLEQAIAAFMPVWAKSKIVALREQLRGIAAKRAEYEARESALKAEAERIAGERRQLGEKIIELGESARQLDAEVMELWNRHCR